VLLQCGLKALRSWERSGHPSRDICLSFLSQTSFAMYESVVETSITRAIMFTPLNPSCTWVINCVIDLVGDQPMLCQRRFKTRKLVFDTRLHCDPDYQRQLGSARSRHIAYVINPSVTACQGRDISPDRKVLLRIPSRLRVGRRALLIAYDYQLPCVVTTLVPHSI